MQVFIMHLHFNHIIWKILWRWHFVIVRSVKVSHHEDQDFFYRVLSVISVVLREMTLTTSVLTCEPVSMESEIVRVVFLRTMKISEITQLIKALKTLVWHLSRVPMKEISSLEKRNNQLCMTNKCGRKRQMTDNLRDELIWE